MGTPSTFLLLKIAGQLTIFVHQMIIPTCPKRPQARQISSLLRQMLPPLRQMSPQARQMSPPLRQMSPQARHMRPPLRQMRSPTRQTNRTV